MPQITCPKCETPMSRLDAAGREVDRCSGCGGMYFDLGELNAVLGDAVAVKKLESGAVDAPADTDAVVKISCPRDGTGMIHLKHHRQTHVGYEQCYLCGGVFLDAGELDDLSSFTVVERIKQMFKVRD